MNRFIQALSLRSLWISRVSFNYLSAPPNSQSARSGCFLCVATDASVWRLLYDNIDSNQLQRSDECFVGEHQCPSIGVLYIRATACFHRFRRHISTATSAFRQPSSIENHRKKPSKPLSRKADYTRRRQLSDSIRAAVRGSISNHQHHQEANFSFLQLCRTVRVPPRVTE